MRLLFALLAVFFLLGQQVSFAQEEASPEATVTLSPSPQSSVDYTLPYPGLLPDNPLYSLKMIRDRIVLLLINDPLKKSEFMLLQADKRLQAGMMLYQKDQSKLPLAIETLSKGVDYFAKAIGQAQQADQQQKDNGAILGKMSQSVRKQEEVLLQLRSQVPPSSSREVDGLLRKVALHKDAVDELIVQ